MKSSKMGNKKTKIEDLLAEVEDDSEGGEFLLLKRQKKR
jgi:hypothetical protein